MNRLRDQKFSGFTLIEVLVALAIAAVALAGLTRSLGVSVAYESGIENRIVATWIAQDVMLKEQMNSDQLKQQVVELYGRKWRIERIDLPTPVPDFQQREYRVYLDSILASEKDIAQAVLATVVATVDE
jgi:general secretion pathway protein I